MMMDLIHLPGRSQFGEAGPLVASKLAMAESLAPGCTLRHVPGFPGSWTSAVVTVPSAAHNTLRVLCRAHRTATRCGTVVMSATSASSAIRILGLV